MKIRKGFVSNSSSSSYIVAFPEEPKNSEHVRQMLFDFDEKFLYFRRYPFTQKKLKSNRGKISTKKIAKYIFNEIEKQEVNNKDNISKGFEKRSICFKFADANDSDVQKFINNNTNSYIYVFQLCDIGGDTIDWKLLSAEKPVFGKVSYTVVDNHICNYIL